MTYNCKFKIHMKAPVHFPMRLECYQSETCFSERRIFFHFQTMFLKWIRCQSIWLHRFEPCIVTVSTTATSTPHLVGVQLRHCLNDLIFITMHPYCGTQNIRAMSNHCKRNMNNEWWLWTGSSKFKCVFLFWVCFHY